MISSVLKQSQHHVVDLYEDLRDGHNLISLLEVLSGETLVSTAVKYDLTLKAINRLKLCHFCLNLQTQPQSRLITQDALT